MEFILFMVVVIVLVLGLMFAVSSEGKNPTPTQIKNRIIMRRKWRKFKKMLAVDDVIAPFVAGLILIFALVVITFKIHGVI
tara:strand:- start:114 stop:356 length:243 start_codon:yes stop_codon:yes gene_type:complete